MHLRRYLLPLLLLALFALGYRAVLRYMQEPIRAEGNGQLEAIFPDWSKPIRVLGTGFREPSGLTTTPNGTLLLIGDEYGDCYELESSSGKRLQVTAFAGAGDYEDLCLVGDTLLVLESDGKIFRNLNGRKLERADWKKLPGQADAEGLWVDEDGAWLACKGQWPGDDRFTRRILFKDRLTDSDWTLFAYWHPDSASDITLPSALPRLDPRKPGLFQPSAISRLPNGNFVLLSAEPPGISLLSERGRWLAFQPVDRGTWPQPEGIGFSSSEIFVVSEQSDRIYVYNLPAELATP